jgi:octaprenyl-diphosphate synthase
MTASATPASEASPLSVAHANHGAGGLAPDVAASLGELRGVAEGGRAEARTEQRLAEVTSLLSVDLAWLASALAAACETGVSPARESASHLIGAGGKRVRPLAALLSAAAAGGLGGDVAPRARTVALAAELIHSATLLHDDVLDDGEERRGRPTSRMLWGNAVSVLAGDLLLTHALEIVAKHAPDGGILPDLLTTLRQLVDGEVIQLRGRAKLDLDEATYERIVQGKTASLFAWACRAGAIAARGPSRVADALGAYGGHVGVAFQLVDDVLDLVGDSKATGKSILTDVREGKPTLPLIRAIARRPALAERVRLLREGAGDADLAAEIGATIVESGAIDDVRTRAAAESRRALGALEAVPSGPAREALAQVVRDLEARVA